MISYKEIKQTKNINTGSNDLDFGSTPKPKSKESYCLACTENEVQLLEITAGNNQESL